MPLSGHLLTQDNQQDHVSGSPNGHTRTLLQAPGGYTSWRAWLLGKSVPLVIFTLFLVANGLTFPREVMQLVHDGVGLYSLMQVLRHFLMLGFLLLVTAAYLTRSHVVARAHGFWERGFPMFVLFATFAGMSFLGHNEDAQKVPLVAVGILLTLIGFYFSLWALRYLRTSFGIMAEARAPVTSGPYQYVRHPLYLGESLSMLGLCLAMGTASALLFWVIWTGMQVGRASIEERKLAHQFEDYRTYRERTRFILPGLY
jgi:protein-S-isoprenylcysteine O-methyltransferase Ste14